VWPSRDSIPGGPNISYISDEPKRYQNTWINSGAQTYVCGILPNRGLLFHCYYSVFSRRLGGAYKNISTLNIRMQKILRFTDYLSISINEVVLFRIINIRASVLCINSITKDNKKPTKINKDLSSNNRQIDIEQ
jgi:hypothetical protein